MKERGALFNAEMVRAILDDRKGNTIRPVRGSCFGLNAEYFLCTDPEKCEWLDFNDNDTSGNFVKSPYGKIGDRLYVRETFRLNENNKPIYKADVFDGFVWKANEFIKNWTPSIHMPRELSRIDLEITGVKVMRVQDITPIEVVKEGLKLPDGLCGLGYIDRFADLWNSLYGDWNENPWVWSYAFKRIN